MRNLFKFFMIIITALPLTINSCHNDTICEPEETDPQVIIVPDDFPTIQEAIDSLPSGGTIKVRSGVYIVSASIHINTSNITLAGERGACLKLGDHINQPVILIGDDHEPPQNTLENIAIYSFEIDGNQANQDTEEDISRPGKGIMNNGIDVRQTVNLWISDVDIHDARSGGIVSSRPCSNIFIDNSIFHDNYFDGIALYDGKEIQVSNFSCYNNGHIENGASGQHRYGAGISIDNNLSYVSFSNGHLYENISLGIFARDVHDISFHNLVIYKNGEDGCFLSHHPGANNTIEPGTGVRRLFFDGCSFLDNNRWGVWLASTAAESPGNAIVSCLFSGNIAGSILDDTNGALLQSGNIFE